MPYLKFTQGKLSIYTIHFENDFRKLKTVFRLYLILSLYSAILKTGATWTTSKTQAILTRFSEF